MREATRNGLAVGFFDGVHRGHQAILARASSVLTFRNHPLSVLAPDRAPRLIMSVEDRLAAIAACGVSDVRALDFTPRLASLSPDDFISRYVSHARVFCGDNWHFGRGGVGNATYLRMRGIDAEVVSYADYEGQPVSSTRIRAALSDGRIDAATAMLGHAWMIRGEVVAGKGFGRKIGFPTINLRPITGLVFPPCGVYEVRLAGVKGVANFGFAPTMGERAWKEPTLEIHLLAPPTAAPQPGESLAVEIVRFVRPERKFEKLEDLQRQIADDCDTILA